MNALGLISDQTIQIIGEHELTDTLTIINSTVYLNGRVSFSTLDLVDTELIVDGSSVLNVNGCLKKNNSTIIFNIDDSKDPKNDIVLANVDCFEGDLGDIKINNYECAQMKYSNNQLIATFTEFINQ